MTGLKTALKGYLECSILQRTCIEWYASLSDNCKISIFNSSGDRHTERVLTGRKEWGEGGERREEQDSL